MMYRTPLHISLKRRFMSFFPGTTLGFAVYITRNQELSFHPILALIFSLQICFACLRLRHYVFILNFRSCG